MENHYRNRKGQSGLPYREFRTVRTQKIAERKGEKKNNFTALLLFQSIMSVTILLVIMAIHIMMPESFKGIETGYASMDIKQAADQAIAYFQSSETFAQLFPDVS